MFWKTWFKHKQSPKISHYQEVFNQFDRVNLETVFSSDKSIVQISVGKRNVIQYTRHLNLLIEKIQNQSLLYAYELDYDIKSVYARDFFIDDQGCFTDPHEVFPLFKTSVKCFLELYEQLEESHDKSFETEKNLMLTQHIVSNLVILSKELSDGL